MTGSTDDALPDDRLAAQEHVLRVVAGRRNVLLMRCGLGARRGKQIAVVAAARKPVVPCWHLSVKGEDYAFARPSLLAHKQRKLELRAGQPAARGRTGPAAGYHHKAVRDAEHRLAEQAEHAYRTLTAGWQPTPPADRRKTPASTPVEEGVDVAAATGARLPKPTKGRAARQG